MAIKRSAWKRALRARFMAGRSFVRDERAVTAIEFGLLGVPFFAIVGAIMETSLVFLSGQILDSAVQDASRLVRTGQANSAGYNAVTFKKAVCDGLYGLFDCTALKLHTSVVSTFGNANLTSNPLDPKTGDWAPDWLNDTYNGGGNASVIMVEAYYKWPVIVSLGGFNLQNTPDGKRLISAVRVFRNEPF
jgi:Flp pilus assembly protein TadG